MKTKKVMSVIILSGVLAMAGYAQDDPSSSIDAAELITEIQEPINTAVTWAVALGAGLLGWGIIRRVVARNAK